MHWDYADGRLGIGGSSICTNPQWELVVGSGVTGGTNGQIFVDATIDGTGDGITIDGDGRSTGDGSLFLIIDKDNNIGMDVGTDGNVGIGTGSSTTVKLDVNDDGVTDNAWNTLAKFRPDLSDAHAEASIHIQSYPSTTVVADRKAGIQSIDDAGNARPLMLNKDGGIVVIGSGATAITLVPSLAKTAAHVTMLQRSPTYVLSRPDVDSVSQKLRRWFPEQFAYDLTRWKNVTAQAILFQLSRRFPNYVKKLVRKVVHAWMGDDFDIDTHFNPSYNPWDQRLCLVPNGDLFRSLRKGTSSIVTDHIERFTENGIQLKSGEILEADIIITATGLELLLLGGLKLEVDGVEKKVSDSLTYKGMMFSGIPNLALAAGYTNASWTLKCDLTSNYVCRLISYMDRHNYQYCVANNDPSVKRLQFLDLASGYVDRAIDQFPKQGDKSPWKLHQNYLLDIMNLRLGSVRDSAMEFYKAK